MEFILGFLGAFLGVVCVILCIAFIVYKKVTNVIGKHNVKEIAHVVQSVKSIQEQEYTRIKDVSGMTKVLEPRILRDFEDFNKEVLYSKVEKSLNAIFNAIEFRQISKISSEEFDLIRSKVEERIEYLKENGIEEKFMDVKFHKHAIKQYEKRDGMATITVSSSLEYYYKNSNEKVKFAGQKKQTRYTTKFSYIYDELKFAKDTKIYTVNCPNCGAPVCVIGKNIVCEFCGSYIKPINLKIWQISSYEEDYKYSE